MEELRTFTLHQTKGPFRVNLSTTSATIFRTSYELRQNEQTTDVSHAYRNRYGGC